MSWHKVLWCTAPALRGAYGGSKTGPRRSPFSPSRGLSSSAYTTSGADPQLSLISGPCHAERGRKTVWPWVFLSMLSVQERASEILLLGSPADNFVAATPAPLDLRLLAGGDGEAQPEDAP